jgi:hypothetical protein
MEELKDSRMANSPPIPILNPQSSILNRGINYQGYS